MYRGALEQLSHYGGDSSDEEVPIGRVSTKRCFIENDEDPTGKRSRTRLPLPQAIYESRTTNTEDVPVDNPAVHGGRTRSFPHERGNWVTYVFIPFEPSDPAIADIVTAIISNLTHLQIKPVDHFHISLTKTVVLRHHWIDSFIQSVQEKTSLIKRFILMYHSLNVYCNEERSRTFIGFDIETGYDTLLQLVEYLDKCLDEFRLPHFYKDPSFHMSLVWCVGDREAEIRSVLPQLCSYAEKILSSYSQNSSYNYVTQLKCKSGNKLFTFNLV